MQDIRIILKTMNRLLPREAKVPVASLSVKAKASACGGLDAKFGYHSKLPILESIKNYESKNRLKTVNKNQDGSVVKISQLFLLYIFKGMGYYYLWVN